MLEHSKGVLGLWNTFSWLGSIRIGIPLMEQLIHWECKVPYSPRGNHPGLRWQLIQVADHDENVHLSRTQQWLIDVVCVFLFEWKDINEGLNHTGLI